MNALDIFQIYQFGILTNAPWQGDDNFEATLSEEEAEYDWRKITLPLSVAGIDLDLSCDPSPGCDPKVEAERFDGIRNWAREIGSISAALAIRPPAIVIDHTKAMTVDGRHRLAIAAQAGLIEVTVLVGIPPGYIPDTDIKFPSLQGAVRRLDR